MTSKQPRLPTGPRFKGWNRHHNANTGLEKLRSVISKMGKKGKRDICPLTLGFSTTKNRGCRGRDLSGLSRLDGQNWGQRSDLDSTFQFTYWAQLSRLKPDLLYSRDPLKGSLGLGQKLTFHHSLWFWESFLCSISFSSSSEQIKV